MKNEVIIIAEAGVNHNGSLDIGIELIDRASEAGADYVKFQTFVAEKIISRFAPKAEYQVQNTGVQESQLDMVRKLELTPGDHLKLQAHCTGKGIGFLSTPFDLESIDLLKGMGITLGKIPSGELVNLPFLRKMAAAFPYLILSTGMATMDEIGVALDVLTAAGADRGSITVLHCTTEYPTPMKEVNLRAMLSIAGQFGVKVGYSDHTAGIEIPIAATALGAVMIEKHFTLDKTMEGPDHVASLDPAELSAMVTAIRNVGQALGDGIKKPSPSEAKNIPIVRKSLVASKRIRRGERFTEENLAAKRPGTGISPMLWDEVIGKIAPKDFEEDELILIQ